ncbi:hypothetical protein JN06_00302 [Bacteroides zoogleoformans]|nr:hypothetical protein JN06_00302 [Bacteroides zoogleoformans]
MKLYFFHKNGESVKFVLYGLNEGILFKMKIHNAYLSVMQIPVLSLFNF